MVMLLTQEYSPDPLNPTHVVMPLTWEYPPDPLNPTHVVMLLTWEYSPDPLNPTHVVMLLTWEYSPNPLNPTRVIVMPVGDQDLMDAGFEAGEGVAQEIQEVRLVGLPCVYQDPPGGSRGAGLGSCDSCRTE